MFSKGRLIFTLASFITVLAMLAATLTAASNRQDADGSGDSLYKNLSIFMEVFGLVNKAYVDEPETEQLMGGALEGALDALDPFSQYIPASGVKRFSEVREVGRARSGMLILKEQGVAYVVAVDEGSPAEEAGLVPGDILSVIGGFSTRSLPLHRIQEQLAGPEGTVLKIERLRQGSKTEVDLTLKAYARGSVELSSHKDVAVLRIAGFHPGTYGDVKASLDALASGEALPGAVKAGKLVVDLRGVAGGDGDVAYKVAGLFSSGHLGKLVGRSGDVQSFDAEGEPLWKAVEEPARPSLKLVTEAEAAAPETPVAPENPGSDGETDGDASEVAATTSEEAAEKEQAEKDEAEKEAKMHSNLVVLVNRGTQGAAEILVAVLEQHLSAVLVGEGTFGHSGLQQIITLSNGGEVHLTRAFYTGPDGEPLDASLRADLRVRDRLQSVPPEAVDPAAAAEVVDPISVDGTGDDENGPAVDPVLERGVDFLLREDTPAEAAAAA